MRKIYFLLALTCLVTPMFGQLGSVTPSSTTQGAVTSGVTSTTTIAPSAVSVSMQNMERFTGPYYDGNVSTNGDNVIISTTFKNVLDFEGTVVSASIPTLLLDGHDKHTNNNRILVVNPSTDNTGSPRELYVIKDTQTGEVWVLYEDPLNPKDK